MRVISPITVASADLLSSNVAETDHSQWDISTTYSAADRVIALSTHKIYESVTGSNLGNDPTTDDGTYWTEISATNRWKAFDGKITDQTSNTGSITYSIDLPILLTAAAILNCAAPEVRIQIYDTSIPAVEVYDQTIILVDDSAIVDWFTYFTEDISGSYETEAIFLGMPGYAGYQMDITVGDGTGTPAVGEIVLGRPYTLGETLGGTSIGIEDFSTKSRDAFGNAIIVERAFIDEVEFQFTLQTADARRVKRILASLRATPAVYFADESILSYGTLVYGFFQDFEIPLSAGGQSTATLRIEGLT